MKLRQLIGVSGTLRHHLIRGASGSLVLKITNTALTLLMAVVLARMLGVENFGIYALCLSLVHILTVPAMLGGQQLLVREVAGYHIKGEFHFLRGLLRRFRQVSLVVSIFLSLVTAGISFFVLQDNPLLVPFLIAAALIPFYSAMQLQGAALRGLRHVLLGQVGLVLRPALVMVVVGIFFWMTGQRLDAGIALSAQLAGSAVLVALTFFLLHRLLPGEAKKQKPGFETSKWARSALPFVFAGGMQILNKETSIFLLGILQTPEDVGLFRVAQRGAMLIPFGLQSVNMAMAPTIAEMFAKGEKKQMQRMIRKSALAAMGFALPVALGFILGGKWLIPFVFGQEYIPAYWPLVILCLGQLVNVGIGSVGIILNMAGLERLTARGVAIAALVSIALNAALIPFFGVIGAALATSICLALWNVLLFAWLYRETGIVSAFRF